jgi:phenylalanyl-tRNA synthetase alpha chain
MEEIGRVRADLLARIEHGTPARELLKSPELKKLYGLIGAAPETERAAYGKAINDLKAELETQVEAGEVKAELPAIDITAPYDSNIAPEKRPTFLPAQYGSIQPLTREIEIILDIFYRMGFMGKESRQLDDDYHMFESLNFPEGHPARDDYDTFMTVQTDNGGHAFIAPAHTSTMQNRILRMHKDNLERGEPIAAIIIDRVFRNEDLDARHEHTFYQHEGIYVGRNVTVGQLMATLQTFLQAYYQKEIEIKTQPFYFPFTEPSLEFSISCPFCDKKGCKVCGEGWIELLGCGMIHPNVLKMADIDPEVYTGFAWGGGVERLVMMKYDIEDIRHFESAKLDFLRQFA